MTNHHYTLADGSTRTWAVEAEAAATAARWVSRAPRVFAADLDGMAAYFPHWLLVASSAGVPTTCQRCGAFHAPAAGALRCIVCGAAAAQTDGLLWVGDLPTLARAEPGFARRRQGLGAAGFGEAAVGELAYLLMPLMVRYPTEWPNVEPIVRYSGRWLDALGLPRSSAAHHLVGRGQACLFSYGQWRAMPIHAVLQQRVVNHVASLLKIVAGQSPEQAFIGKIHDDVWRPER